jgi:hypothetical protein
VNDRMPFKYVESPGTLLCLIAIRLTAHLEITAFEFVFQHLADLGIARALRYQRDAHVS